MEHGIKEEVVLPEGFSARVQNNTVHLAFGGKEGFKQFKVQGIRLEAAANKVIVSAARDNKESRAIVNTVKAILENLAAGLQREFVYRLAIVYSHFPMNASIKEGCVEVSNFLGRKKPVRAKIVQGAKVEVKGKEIIVSGWNREAVGQTAANLEQLTKIKNKDRRIFQDGIYIVSKGE